MSEAQKKPSNNQTIIIAVLVFVLAIGGYMYYKQTQTETVSMSFGDHKISATVKK